jgi:hypothetical protein
MSPFVNRLALACLVLLFVFCHLSLADSNNCQGTQNTIPPWDGELTLVNTTQNGALYLAGPEGNQISVLHLYGSPYEMGVAQGQLLKDKMEFLYQAFYTYVEETIGSEPIIDDLPQHIIDEISEKGANFALELEFLATKEFIPQHFFEEMRGLAHGSGIELAQIHRMHMFPELIRAACSMFGAWGKATQSSTNGGLIQLRALDFGTDNPFRKVPLLSIYHPDKGQGNVYSQLTFAGFLGAFTGYGAETAICEKLWMEKDYNGSYTRKGIPWNFLLRDILQFDKTIDDALDRIDSANRTCSIFIGLGDHQSQTFRAVEYSLSYVRVFNDTTPFPAYAPPSPQHPLFDDLVYIDKHGQPNSDPCMASLLSEYYGSIDPLNSINLMGQFETGDLHSAVYDFKNNDIYVGVASQDVEYPTTNTSAVLPAYERQFLKFDMDALFNLERPKTN